MSSRILLPFSLIGFASFVSAFTSTSIQHSSFGGVCTSNGNNGVKQLRSVVNKNVDNSDISNDASSSATKDIFEATASMKSTRKAFLASIVGATVTTVTTVGAAAANADDGGFESIAARAANIAKIVEAEEAKKDQEKEAEAKIIDSRTVYDFSVPVAGVDIPFKDLIKQEFITTETSGENEGEVIKNTQAKVKAILVVNIKQDDPIARRNIPELISLAAK